MEVWRAGGCTAWHSKSRMTHCRNLSAAPHLGAPSIGNPLPHPFNATPHLQATCPAATRQPPPRRPARWRQWRRPAKCCGRAVCAPSCATRGTQVRGGRQAVGRALVNGGSWLEALWRWHLVTLLIATLPSHVFPCTRSCKRHGSCVRRLREAALGHALRHATDGLAAMQLIGLQ